MEFLLQPSVYSTGSTPSLLKMLDNMWLKEHKAGDGTLYILSGFANYNGGVRFYPYFSRHIQQGGKMTVIIGGSSSQRLSSFQVVHALLQCGAKVYIINRKRLVHAKCYGYVSNSSEGLVVTSGNFTGPGMSQNAEAAIRIDDKRIKEMNFSWESLVGSIFNQPWDIYHLESSDIDSRDNPGWSLLYDEFYGIGKLEESQELTMIITLSHSDTARIQASPGSKASRGTQYFWLSKGTFDFFPALTEKNRRGTKDTYSCIINMSYIDIGESGQTRVTFEADNNLDFRLGTGALKYTKVADKNDLALMSRLSEFDYELRIVKSSSIHYECLLRYATTYIGNYGKRFGYIGNDEVKEILSSSRLRSILGRDSR